MALADRAALRSTVAALMVVLLAGCSGSTSSSPSPSRSAAPVAGIERYVALGDSFTAAPFVPVTDLADGCFRSSGNYPSLLAEDLGAELVDVSCGAATTVDLLARQSVAQGRGSVPAQVRAVGRSTDLVTVGIGGNDEDLFSSLLGCALLVGLPGADTGCDFGAALRDRAETVDEVVTRTGRRVARVLRAVRRAAPGARVVLVGYPRLVAADGCAALPLGAAARRLAIDLERTLNEALGQAARRADAAFVDMHGVSRRHEICSADPWVNGRRTDQQRALAFHPFPAGQRAVADALLAQLTR